MADVIVKVDPQILKNTAGVFESKAGQIRTITDNMLATVNSLSSAWEGAAQQAYAQKFKALDGDMAQMYVEINDHAKALIEIADVMLNAERGNTEAPGGLATDYI